MSPDGFGDWIAFEINRRMRADRARSNPLDRFMAAADSFLMEHTADPDPQIAELADCYRALAEARRQAGE